MSLINRPGTIVRLPDGRIGTTIYNGLDGVGIKWGRHPVTLADFPQTPKPTDWPFYPDAMLRSPYPGADLPCVGDEYEIEGPAQEEKHENPSTD